MKLELAVQWLEAKESERAAVELRREIEDAMIKLYKIPETLEGVDGRIEGNYQVKITGRMNKKVDTESLQEIAAEEGLSDYLPSLFRWSADINSAVWKATDSSITDKLLGAITIKPGRPSFAITQQEEK